MTQHHYRAFGLVFRAPFALPSLGSAAIPPTSPDVVIELGAVAPPDPGIADMDMIAQADGDAFVLDVPESARFRIERGCRMIVQPDAGADEAQVHAYLLGSALGALLHQRGLLPLHCNAIALDGRAHLLCGDSGAGKSTLAAYFEQRGHRLLTDDICAVQRDAAGTLIAWPGLPRLKLWRESLDALALDDDEMVPVPWTADKYELKMRSRASGPLPVAGLYHLREAGEGRAAGIHRLGTLDALNTVTANIYRRRLADIMGRTADYLRTATAIVASHPVWSFNRKWGLERFTSEAERIISHMRANGQ